MFAQLSLNLSTTASIHPTGVSMPHSFCVVFLPLDLICIVYFNHPSIFSKTICNAI